VILRPAADAMPRPWRNGGGVTRELLCLPAGAGDDWTLRISVADIEADGPFSAFPGITRWFAAVAGAGVRLDFRDAGIDVRPGSAPLCFDGAEAPGCTLLDGATRDLNVMVRSGRADATVTAATFPDPAVPGPGTGFGFFALRALALHGAGAEPLAMPVLSLAWCEPPFDASRPWSVAPLGDSGAAPDHTPPGYWIRLLPPKR